MPAAAEGTVKVHENDPEEEAVWDVHVCCDGVAPLKRIEPTATEGENPVPLTPTDRPLGPCPGDNTMLGPDPAADAVCESRFSAIVKIRNESSET